MIISQSKALNSNSGVAFSPPSIVKDALGDSGLLMDPDMTIANSPENSSAQVYNIINTIENKLFMCDSNNPSDNHMNSHFIDNQTSSMNEQFSMRQNAFGNRIIVRHPHTINMTATSSMQRTKSNQLNLHNQVQIPNFIKLTEKNFPIIKRIQTDSNSLKNIHVSDSRSFASTANAEFNPFADENESYRNFQLSKSNASTDQSTHFASKIRAFGTDRTNFDSHIGNVHIPNVQKPNIPTHTLTSNSFVSPELIDENTVMFKTYDLNDEYWLNFE